MVIMMLKDDGEKLPLICSTLIQPAFVAAFPAVHPQRRRPTKPDRSSGVRSRPHQHRPLGLPIQWHHPAQHALQIDRHIGIGEQIGHNRRGQQRQSQQAPGLRYIDAFGSRNVSDRPKLAFIEQPLPVVRQPQRAYQWRVLRRLALGALCCGLQVTPPTRITPPTSYPSLTSTSSPTWTEARDVSALELFGGVAVAVD